MFHWEKKFQQSVCEKHLPSLVASVCETSFITRKYITYTISAMRWLLNDTIALAILIFAIFTKVSADAVFELQLTDFVNEFGRNSDGYCCSGYEGSDGQCSEKCLTKFRVCLNVYQKDINVDSPCTFGEKITPIMGSNSVHFNNSGDMRFKIESWQGTFSLIIEAWHQDEINDSVNGPILVNRMGIQRFLSVGDHWTKDYYTNGHSNLDYQFRVVCQEHYFGAECRKYCKPRDDNFGHYECDSNGNRVCLPGWRGEPDSYCSQPVCLPGCMGMCLKPNECLCPIGYDGILCDQCKTYPGCLHGTCEKPWDCHCTEGWGGLFCNQDLNYCTNHEPCRNGATCFNTSPGSYSCECPPGFNGTNCEIVNDSCANSPCQNGGACLDTGDQGFVCQCPSGQKGRYCELSGNSCADQPCKNGATCRATSAGYQCECALGFQGSWCEQSINDCLSAPCLNGGSCVDDHKTFKCVCPVGYAGRTCETNIDDCAQNPCLNNGKCVDGLDSFKCQCRPGFVGHLCEENVNDCAAMPCANGATCIDGVNSVRCLCNSGWRGKFCTKIAAPVVSPCENRPCDNGGYCKPAPELSAGYRCTCPHGYVGPRCTVLESSLVRPEAQHTSKPMSSLQIVLIITCSVAVPCLAFGFAIAIICMRRRRHQEMSKNDEEARRQNEQNTVHNAVNNNKKSNEHKIFNALAYPVKPINTDQPQCYIQAMPYVEQKLSSAYSKNTLDSSYSIAPARSTKTINTDISRSSLALGLENDLTDGSRSSLALKLEKDLDAYPRKSPCCEVTTRHTPDPCPSPSSVYLIENNYNDDSFIATEV